MANRVPIVVDSDLFRFEELQIGDDLDLTSNNIINVTSLTAATVNATRANVGLASCQEVQAGIYTGQQAYFSQLFNVDSVLGVSTISLLNADVAQIGFATITNLNADVAQIGFATITNLNAGIVSFSGSADFTDITVSGEANFLDINCRNIISSGILTNTFINSVDAYFSGNVTIGGTLTYEDVTNVDAIGLITARSGINVGQIGATRITLNPDGTSLFQDVINGTNINLSGILTTPSINATAISCGNLNCSGTVTSVEFSTPSDIALKKDINPIQNALDIINSLKPVSWKWKTNSEPAYGLIAQDLEKVLPELVGKQDHISLINYISLIGYIIKALQELDKKITK